MQAEEFYTNILMGVAGNTAYDGLKGYLQQWKNIVLPKAKTENEVLHWGNCFLNKRIRQSLALFLKKIWL
jgi:hypothetical protein